MKRNKRIIRIDTKAMLKHRYCDVEWHLKNENSSFYRYWFPLNIFQVWMYKLLGFDYISGEDYINLMTLRCKEGKL